MFKGLNWHPSSGIDASALPRSLCGPIQPVIYGGLGNGRMRLSTFKNRLSIGLELILLKRKGMPIFRFGIPALCTFKGRAVDNADLTILLAGLNALSTKPVYSG